MAKQVFVWHCAIC